MSHYVEIADINNFPANMPTAEKQAVIDRAEALVEEITHDFFYPKPFNLVLNGNGKSMLFLGLVPNILSISSIKLSEVLLPASLYAYDKDTVFRASVTTSQCKNIEDVVLSGSDPISVVVTSHGFITGEAVRLVTVVGISPSLDGEYICSKVDANTFTLNGTDSSDYAGSFVSGIACFASLAYLHYLAGEEKAIFPKGIRNVAIEGTYGWVNCPETIKYATVVLCRAENDSTLYNRYTDVDSERLGDAAYSRSSKDYLTGIFEADHLLCRYIRRKARLGAV